MITYETALSAFKQASAELGKPWIDTPEQEECLSRLIKWAIRSDEYKGRLTAGIRLRGHRDSGKTHAMKCLQRMLNRLHKGDQYSSQRNAFEIMACQDMVSQYNLEGDEALIAMSAHERVMYDDLGEEREGNFMGKHCNVLLEVLGRRYRRMQERAMLTLITTNLPNEEADVQRYGERIATRLTEMCDTIVWKGPKEGFRKKVEPLGWLWPGSPQEIEAEAERRRLAEAEWRARAERDRLKHEKEQAEERERKRKVREAELIEAAKGLDQIGMDTLLNMMRMHPDQDMKDLYRKEVERRTKATVDEVEKFLTSPTVEDHTEETAPARPQFRVVRLHQATPAPDKTNDQAQAS